MTRSAARAAPLLLFVIVTGAYWKLLTKQYTWMDHPDMAYQVLPWYQSEAVSWHRGEFPLWDPKVWGGQPLIGQLQPGAAYPPNWLLFLLPLKDGHIQRLWLHLYFILTHFFAALFCYWLCRDLGRTVSASVFAGFTFALAGLVGSIEWPQMLNGAIWIPLVVLFYLRSVRGPNPLQNASFSGTFLGISFLSGHHQIPTFIGLMMAGLWVVELWRRDHRLPVLKQAGVFVLFAALVSALQVLPAYEYATRSIRWVGSQNPVSWGQYVPYTVHQQYSLAPLNLLGFAISGGNDHYTFLGITVLTLALLGFGRGFEDRVVKLLGGVCAGGLLFAMGGFSVFHGVAYLLIPTVEKARTPAMAVVVVQFALAVLASYGLDALRQRPAGRGYFAGLMAIGILPWPVLAVLSSIRPETSREYERFAVAALAALAMAVVFRGWESKRLSGGVAVTLLSLTTIFELGTVVGQGYRHREMPGGYLQVLEQHQDVVDFLKNQGDFVRLDVDTDALPYNIGDWDGIDQFRAYLGGMTSNLAPFEVERLKGGQLARHLFGLNYAVGTKPFGPGQQEVFHGAFGLNVYRNPAAFPLIWTVHRTRLITGDDPARELGSMNLRSEVALKGPLPVLDDCSKDENLRLLNREATRIIIQARMDCKGMLILSQTYFPGWQATVDGSAVPIEEAYGVLDGVLVGPGTHRVEFRYRPLSVYLGGILTGGGLIAALSLAVFRRSGVLKPAAASSGL